MNCNNSLHVKICQNFFNLFLFFCTLLPKDSVVLNIAKWMQSFWDIKNNLKILMDVKNTFYL